MAMARSKKRKEVRVRDARFAKSGPKRRYRLRRYRTELHYLRSVTPEMLEDLDSRAPDCGRTAREVICFGIRAPDEAKERLAIIAFGYDGVCYIVDLSCAAGRDDA